jgi:hypothetical protein
MTSLRKAIDAKCKECIYDPCQNGTWRQQVEACTSPSCPLFSVRPLPIANNSSNLVEKYGELAQNEHSPIPEHYSTNNELNIPLISIEKGE